MSAVNSVASSESASERKTYEPSMEEILASIRRIIADDQSLPGRAWAREPEPQAPKVAPHLEAPSVVEPPSPLAEAIGAPADPSVPAALGPEAEPAPDATQAHGQVSAPQFASPDVVDRQLLDPTAVYSDPELAAEISAFDADDSESDEPTAAAAPETFAAQEHKPPVDEAPVEEPAYESAAAPAASPLFSAATDNSVTSAFNMLAASRLADNSDDLLTLAREMIRPLLRSWIDDNLPSMVERMVRAEIERVARGGR